MIMVRQITLLDMDTSLELVVYGFVMLAFLILWKAQSLVDMDETKHNIVSHPLWQFP